MVYSDSAKAAAWAYLRGLRYIPCRDQFDGGANPKRVVFMHEMVAPERDDMAESLGNYFRDPRNPDGSARYASTHFGVDSDSAVRYAEFYRVVYGTEGWGNVHGWHIEQAGLGTQSPDEWQDSYSQAMLKNQSSRLCAALCVVDDLPVVHVDVAGLRELKAGRGDGGISTHFEACQAFMAGNQSQWHYDPKNFPMEQFLGYVREHVASFTGEDDDMPSAQEVAEAAAQKVMEALVGNAQAQGQPWAIDPVRNAPYPTFAQMAAAAGFDQYREVIESLAEATGAEVRWDAGRPTLIPKT